MKNFNDDLSIDASRFYLALVGTDNDLFYEKFSGKYLLSDLSEYDRVCSISEILSFEIYTCDPASGEKGWNIKLVNSTKGMIKHYPDFDCIISVNDCIYNEEFFLEY